MYVLFDVCNDIAMSTALPAKVLGVNLSVPKSGKLSTSAEHGIRLACTSSTFS